MRDQKTDEVVRRIRELLEQHPKHAKRLLEGLIAYQERAGCPDNVEALKKILREEYADA